MSNAREQSPFTKSQQSLYQAIKQQMEIGNTDSIHKDKIVANPRTLAALEETHSLIRICDGGFITLTHIPENLTPVQRFVYIDIINKAGETVSVEKSENWNWKTLHSLKDRGLIETYGNQIVLNLVKNNPVSEQQKHFAKVTGAMGAIANSLGLSADTSNKVPNSTRLAGKGISLMFKPTDEGFVVESIKANNLDLAEDLQKTLLHTIETYGMPAEIVTPEDKGISYLFENL